MIPSSGSQRRACSACNLLLLLSFLLGLLFNPEDGGNMFLKNAGNYNPENHTLSTHKMFMRVTYKIEARIDMNAI
jgi:hypothetical protein